MKEKTSVEAIVFTPQNDQIEATLEDSDDGEDSVAESLSDGQVS